MPRRTAALALLALLTSPALGAAPAAQKRLGQADEAYRRRITPVVEVAQNAAPAVVFIQTEGYRHVADWFGRVFAQRVSGSGSGVIVKKQGFVITNYHVVRDARQIRVSLPQQYDDEVYTADLVSFVEVEDLALLKIRAEREFPTLPLGTSADLMPGETVIAIGNPYENTHTVSQGIISGLHRNVPVPNEGLRFSDLIQTDAAINSGNSGGPLLNINGEVIGINTVMNVAAQNIGFAIPVDRVKTVLRDRLLSDENARTWLGFRLEPGDHLRIGEIIAGSPADQGGLQQGDCIVSLNGIPVATSEDYRLTRLALPLAEEVEVGVDRLGATRRLLLRPWDIVTGTVFERIGAQVETVRVGRGQRIRITGVDEDGPAGNLGLRQGDVLDGLRILGGSRPRAFRLTSADDLAAILNTELASGSRIEVDVLRDDDGDGHFQRGELYRGELSVR